MSVTTFPFTCRLIHFIGRSLGLYSTWIQFQRQEKGYRSASFLSSSSTLNLPSCFRWSSVLRLKQAVTEPDHKNQEQSRHPSSPLLTEIEGKSEYERHRDYHACEGGPGLGSFLRSLVKTTGRRQSGDVRVLNKETGGVDVSFSFLRDNEKSESY